MNRDYPYHEEIKIMMSEVFREGNETDARWTARYEAIKEKTPLEQMGQMMDLLIGSGYSLQEASKVIKQLLVEAKKKHDIETT